MHQHQRPKPPLSQACRLKTKIEEIIESLDPAKFNVIDAHQRRKETTGENIPGVRVSPAHRTHTPCFVSGTRVSVRVCVCT